MMHVKTNIFLILLSIVIINHAPIQKYCLIFLLREEFKYLCGLYPIESRKHILYKCKKYNNY